MIPPAQPPYGRPILSIQLGNAFTFLIRGGKFRTFGLSPSDGSHQRPPESLHGAQHLRQGVGAGSSLRQRSPSPQLVPNLQLLVPRHDPRKTSDGALTDRLPAPFDLEQKQNLFLNFRREV